MGARSSIEVDTRLIANARTCAQQERQSTWPGLLILVYAFLACSSFAFLTPAFETPDEPNHLAYVNFVARTGTLPNAYESPALLQGEAHQHPLYYVLGAVLIRGLTAAKEINVTITTNNAHIWNGGDRGDVPLYGKPSWTTQAAETGFYGLRLFSVCLAVATVWYILRLGELVFRGDPWRYAPALFVATLPQFLFIAGSVNNDNLVNLCAAASLFYTFLLLRHAAPIRTYMLLGLWTGLGLLTKATAVFILPSIALVLVYLLVRHPSQRRRLATGGVLCGLAVLILSGGVFVRNQAIYGDPLALHAEKVTLSGLLAEKTLLSRYFWRPDGFPGALYESFVGKFGWMQFALPQGVYALYGALFALAGLGIVWHLRAADWGDAPIWFAGLSVTLSLAGVVALNLTFSQPQGRLLFPALASMGLLVATGLQAVSVRARSVMARQALLFALLLALVTSDGLALRLVWVTYAGPH